jgi:hypothetical protein
MNTPTRSLVLAVLALAGPVFAQQPVDPKDVPENIRKAQEDRMKQEAERRAAAANAANPAKPIERPTPSVKSTDPDVQALVKLLSGSFASAAAGDTPELSLSSVVITVDGIDNAVYFELARKDSTWTPFRQGVWQVWKKNGNLTVRQYDFTNVAPTFKAAMVGMWAAPDMFPVLKASQLVPLADITLTSSGGNYSGTGAGPTMIEGAFEFSTSWIVTADSLSFTDRGSDITGKQVWGPASGAAGPSFKRGTPVVKTERRTGGVVVIDFVPPTATERKLEEFGDAAGIATYYTDAGAEVYSSATPDRTGAVNPFRWTQGNGRNLAGLNIGGAGVTVGTVRRVYIPTAQAFGVNGTRGVGPNTDLILALQTQWVGEPKPPAATPTAAPGMPAPGAPAATPTPKPATPSPAATPKPAQ